MPRIRVFALALLSALLAFGLPARAVAQVLYGSLVVEVRDQTGSAVPGAEVTITQTETNWTRSGTSNETGTATFSNVPLGTFSVRTALSGFKESVTTDVRVTQDDVTRVRTALTIGELSETLTVSSSTAILQTERADVRTEISSVQLQNLPVPPGRNYQNMFVMVPGISPPENMHSVAVNPARGLGFNSNGTTRNANAIRIEGAISNNLWLPHVAAYVPALEAIETVSVVTSSFDADLGLSGGMSANVVIKSGTNQFRGSGFDYFYNEHMKSRPYFLPADQSKPEARQNQFGGTLGGPIVKNRAFFFGDYQGLKLHQGRTATLTVPTALMRQGIFSEVANQIFDPLTGVAFEGNIIRSDRLNPISQQVANTIYPMPTQPGLANNYVENIVLAQRVNAGDARVDYKFKGGASLFGRYSESARTYDDQSPANMFMGNGASPATNNSTSSNRNGVVGYTRAIGSNKFFELRGGYNRYYTHQYAEDSGVDKNNQLGIPNGNLAAYPETFGIASFQVSGFSSTGSPGTTNAERVGRIIHITNNLSWLTGRHSMKFGADLRLYKGAVTNPQTQPQGRFTFDGNYTSRAGAAGTGYSFASFMLGYPTRIQRDVVDTYPEVTNTFLGLFAQDDFRLSSKLSLQLGLRWDLMTPPVQASNRQSNFSLNDGFIHVASDQDRTAGVDTHYDYVAPRLGMAYSPDNGKTAVRAAFGVSYFADNFGANGGTNERNYPFFQQIDLTFPTFTPARSVSDGLPAFSPVPLAPTLTPPAGFAVFYIPQHFHADTVTMWNVGIQREVVWNMVLDVSYVGTRGTHLFRSYNINVPDPGQGSINPRRPYFSIAPTITTINMRDGDGESWYDALQLKLDKHFSHGLQMLVSYTRSRTDDNVTPASLAPQLADLRMRALSKAIDIPNIFVASWTYELPIGPGKTFLSDSTGVVKALTDGWTMSAITNYHSGDPLDVRVSASQLNTGGGNWADKTCDEVGMPRELGKWFDTACFANPAQFQFGNYRIGDVRGPTVFNTDFSVGKRTAMGARSFEIRFDVFNVFNRAHFANPNVTFGTSPFGSISATRLTPREVQLGLRFLF
jgi:Carboxypeptidase regulatory-like domain/TonB dependent receptor